MKSQAFTTKERTRRYFAGIDRRCGDGDESGTGIIGTMFGALVFLAFVALATHTMVGLYATSVVTATTWDMARQVAEEPDDSLALSDADANARQRLSGLHNVSLQWVTNNSTVSLTISADRPSLLPHSLAKQTSLTTITHTATVRKEEVRNNA